MAVDWDLDGVDEKTIDCSGHVEPVVRRFYVDERSGCVAVREHVDYDVSPGLHQDLPDVMAYWGGEKYTDDGGMVRWRVADWQLEKANKLCERLTA